MSGHTVRELDLAGAANKKLNPKAWIAFLATALAVLCGLLLEIDQRLLGLIVAAIVAGATGVDGTAD